MNNIFLTFNNHANVEDEFYISQQKTDIVERDKSDAHNYMARDYGSKKKKNYNWFSGTNQDAAIVTTNEKCLEQQHTQNLF